MERTRIRYSSAELCNKMTLLVARIFWNELLQESFHGLLELKFGGKCTDVRLFQTNDPSTICIEKRPNGLSL